MWKRNYRKPSQNFRDLLSYSTKESSFKSDKDFTEPHPSYAACMQNSSILRKGLDCYP